MKISFIVVGKNEGKKLPICFKSVIKTIDFNGFRDSEIIYVDSCSVDDSIEVAKEYNIKTIIIKGEVNSAVARNVGVRNSGGEILVFVDGDMELIPQFFNNVIIDNKLVYPFVSGQFINYYYSPEDGEFLYKEPYHNFNNQDKLYQTTTGGLFIMERWLWNLVDGMREDFRRSQDMDLGLRLSRKGYKLLRYKDVMANHHTIKYTDRLWDIIFNGNSLYRFYLYKRNLFNKYAIRRMIKKDSTFFLLILSLINSIIITPKILIIFLITMLLLSIFYYKKKFTFDKPLFLITRDIISIYSFLFFFPSKEKNYTVEHT